MILTFRNLLKAAAAHNGAQAKHTSGYYGVLKLDGRIVWESPVTFRKRAHGSDCKQLAVETAEAALHCDDGSLLATELQGLCDSVSPGAKAETAP